MERKRLEVTLVVVLRLIINDGDCEKKERKKRNTNERTIAINPCLEIKRISGRDWWVVAKNTHTYSRITVLVVDRDTERLSRMYKILLCYAQTSTRREEREDRDERERKSTYIIYIQRDCVRDKALLYKTRRGGWWLEEINDEDGRKKKEERKKEERRRRRREKKPIHSHKDKDKRKTEKIIIIMIRTLAPVVVR